MKVITGDETGLVKLVNPTNQTILQKIGNQSRNNSIKKLIWIEINLKFLILKENNQLEVWKIENNGRELRKFKEYSINLTLSNQTNQENENKVIEVITINENLVLCCTREGKISLINLQTDEISNVAYNLRAPIEKLEGCSNFQRFASGGQKNDLQVWDSNEGKVIWSEKNVPHD